MTTIAQTPLSPKLAPKIARAAETPRQFAVGIVNQFMLTSADTGGQFCLASHVAEPNAGPPPHLHEREDEVFLITEGQFEFLIGEEIVVAGPGDVVFGPRGVPHTWRNCGETKATLYIVATGPTFDTFLAKFFEMAGTPNPDFEAILDMGLEYGIDLRVGRK